MNVDPNFLVGVARAAFFGSQKGKPESELRKVSDLTQEERTYWTHVAENVLKALHWEALEPGMTSTLFGSGDFPDTKVEVVSTRHPTLVTIKLIDGTTREVEQLALIDWSSDWIGKDDKGKEWMRHIDTFSSPRPAYPITGLAWGGGDPDVLKAQKIIEQIK